MGGDYGMTPKTTDDNNEITINYMRDYGQIRDGLARAVGAGAGATKVFVGDCCCGLQTRCEQWWRHRSWEVTRWVVYCGRSAVRGKENTFGFGCERPLSNLQFLIRICQSDGIWVPSLVAGHFLCQKGMRHCQHIGAAESWSPCMKDWPVQHQNTNMCLFLCKCK